jgi:hypothetical protein
MAWKSDDDDDSDEYIPDNDAKDEEFTLNKAASASDASEEDLSESETGFQVSVRELEEDTDMMFQEQGELYNVWPLITICDLDRKLPTKLKKSNYEPIDGYLGNISFIDDLKCERVEGDLKLTKDEEFIVQCLVDHFKLDHEIMYKEYTIIKLSLGNINIEKVNLSVLKKLSPTTDVLVLNQLWALMLKFDILKVRQIN